MHTLQFSKSYYHIQEEVRKWLTDHFGEPGWYDVHNENSKARWAWHSHFGTTYYRFYYVNDYNWVLLKYGDQCSS